MPPPSRAPLAAVAPAPLFAALLVGGASRRMGRPKQTLVFRGATFAERIAGAARGLVEQIFVCGAGELPPALANLPRLHDREALRGPIAGLLGAFDARPDVAWLALACDQPRLSRRALVWLAGERRAGAIAVLPRLDVERIEPLPAIYEPAARGELEAIARRKGALRSLQGLAEVAAVRIAPVPDELRAEFAGANDPDELAALGEAGAERSR